MRITKDRRSFYRTILHVEPEYWDAKNERIKNKHPNVVELNALLDRRVAEIKKKISLVEITDNYASISVIRNQLDNRTSFDVFEYADKEMELMFNRGQLATCKKYKSVIKKLKAYVKKDVLPIKNITLEFVKQYENHLLNELNNNRNTVTVNLKALARLVNDIYRNYDLEFNNNPFKKFKMKRELTERVYLEANKVNITPDRYIFNILTVDIDKISPQDALNAISGATDLINKYLKKVAEKAEIQKNISTHSARHREYYYYYLINRKLQEYFS